MDLGNAASLSYFAPELLIVAAILAIVLLDLVVKRKSILGDIALISSAAALLLIGLSHGSEPGWLFNRMLVSDSFALFFRALIALGTVVSIWMSIGSEEVRGSDQGEYYAILLSSALGMLLMAEAANLLMAYLSLEFVSLTSYIL